MSESKKPHTCDQCDYISPSLTDLMDHIKKTSNHDAICILCDKPFKTYDNLRKHKREYHGSESSFKCESCDKRYKTKSLLRSHSYTVHDLAENLFCNLCSKPCTNTAKLRRHTLQCLKVVSDLSSFTMSPDSVEDNGLLSNQKDFENIAKHSDLNKVENGQFELLEGNESIQKQAKDEEAESENCPNTVSGNGLVSNLNNLDNRRYNNLTNRKAVEFEFDNI